MNSKYLFHFLNKKAHKYGTHAYHSADGAPVPTDRCKILTVDWELLCFNVKLFSMAFM